MTTAEKETGDGGTTTTDEAPQAKTRTIPEITIGGRGLNLATFADMWEFARAAAQTDLVPKDDRGKPHNILIKIQHGAEIGLPPMTSIQSVAVINGRPTVYGDAFLAVAMASPVFDHAAYREEFSGKPFDDSYTATCTVSRVGRVDSIVQSFSVGDAKRAKLWGKAGPWTDHPRRMLMWRARGFAFRDAFPDVLKGMYCREEITAESVLSQIDTSKLDGDELRESLTAPAEPPAPEEPAEPTGPGGATASELRTAIGEACNKVGLRSSEILAGCGIKTRSAVAKCDDIEVLTTAYRALTDAAVEADAPEGS